MRLVRSQASIQRRLHISRTDAVHSDPMRGPLDRQARRELPDRGLGGVVRRLGLRHVDDGARHAADQNQRPARFPLHQVLRHRDGGQIGAVDVDTP